MVGRTIRGVEASEIEASTVSRLRDPITAEAFALSPFLPDDDDVLEVPGPGLVEAAGAQHVAIPPEKRSKRLMTATANVTCPFCDTVLQDTDAAQAHILTCDISFDLDADQDEDHSANGVAATDSTEYIDETKASAAEPLGGGFCISSGSSGASDGGEDVIVLSEEEL